MTPQKQLFCGTYDLSAFSNQECHKLNRLLPAQISRHEDEPSYIHKSGLRDTLYGKDAESRARGRKRSRAESPGTTALITKLPIAEANIEVYKSPSLLAESQDLVSQKVHDDDSPLHEIVYYNSSDKSNSDVHFRPQKSIAFSRRLNNASKAFQGKTIDDGTKDSSWSNAVCGLVIVLASHMWQFCKMNAFRGFRAGGGIGFVWKERGNAAVIEKEDASLVASERDATQRGPQQHLPRYFGSNLDYSPTRDDKDLHNDWMIIAPSSLSAAEPKSAEDTPRHASKRQQVDSDGAWLTVSHHPSGYNHHDAGSGPRPETSSATRKRVRKAHLAGGRHHRPCSCSSPRSSSYSRLHSQQNERTSSYSFKSDSPHNQLNIDHSHLSLYPGSPLQRESRTPERSLMRRKSWQGQQHNSRLLIDPWAVDGVTVTTVKSVQHTPVRTVFNTTSVDSDAVALRKFRPESAFASGSPLSADARRYQIRQRRKERKADASIRKVNDQLKDMIREGREALGSRVSIETGVDDNDWS